MRSTDDVNVADINTSQARFALIDGSNSFQYDNASRIRYRTTYTREDFEIISSTGVKLAEMTALRFSAGVDATFTQTEQKFSASVTSPFVSDNVIDTDLKSSQVGLYAGARVVQYILPNFSVFAGAMVRPGVSKLELDADQTFQGSTVSVEYEHVQHTFAYGFNGGIDYAFGNGVGLYGEVGYVKESGFPLATNPDTNRGTAVDSGDASAANLMIGLRLTF